MSLEVRTYDVLPEEEQTLLNIMYTFGWTLKNSQRVYSRTRTPVGAFTYQGVTLIQSETETDEYTTMTFERETNIGNYRRIASLEKELWELIPYMTASRPLEPPPMLDFKDWLRSNNPNVVPFWENLLVAILSGSTYLAILSSLLYGVVDAAPVVALPVCIPLLLLTTLIYSQIRKKSILRNPDSKGYKKRFIFTQTTKIATGNSSRHRSSTIMLRPVFGKL